MDDTTQQNQMPQGNGDGMPQAPSDTAAVGTNDQPAQDAAPVMPAADTMTAGMPAVSSMSDMASADLSSMVPPVPSGMDQSVTPAPAQDAMSAQNAMPADTNAPAQLTSPEDEYAYAEDILDEILDSLDRIESKLEAIEKKVGQ